MKFTKWLKEEKGIPVIRLRKKFLNNKEWERICTEYERFCESKNIRPVYD